MLLKQILLTHLQQQWSCRLEQLFIENIHSNDVKSRLIIEMSTMLSKA